MTLTPRQHEILRLMAAGLNDRQIAERLHVSTDTVRRDNYRMYARELKATGRAHAVAIGYRTGLLEEEGEHPMGDHGRERMWLLPADSKPDVVYADGRHRYWSTHCRHAPLARVVGQPDGHDACSATEIAPGVPRRPAQCKTCGAPCVCPCHQSTIGQDAADDQ